MHEDDFNRFRTYLTVFAEKISQEDETQAVLCIGILQDERLSTPILSIAQRLMDLAGMEITEKSRKQEERLLKADYTHGVTEFVPFNPSAQDALEFDCECVKRGLVKNAKRLALENWHYGFTVVSKCPACGRKDAIAHIGRIPEVPPPMPEFSLDEDEKEGLKE